MPRYIVERSFPEGFEIPPGPAGNEVCEGLVEVNEHASVTWVHSYVRDDTRAMFCVYDAPNPEAIRRAGERNGMPVDRISRVTVLDPYSYKPRADAVRLPHSNEAGHDRGTSPTRWPGTSPTHFEDWE